MKTNEFSILLVDDNKEFVDTVAVDLETWLVDKGFQLKFSLHLDKASVLEQLKKTDAELLIVDYSLQKGTGDDVIKAIRENDYLQDVVFYTGGPIERLFQDKLEGVFYASKEDAPSTIKEIIKSKLKRFSDHATFRGWVVADAIELEEIVTDLLEKCFVAKDGYTFSKRFFYDSDAPIDFGRKVTILRGILNDLLLWLQQQPTPDAERIRKIDECNKVYKDFTEEIVLVRNALAHSKTEVNEDKKVIKMKTKNGKPLVLDEPTFVKIRTDLRKHYDNLVRLQVLI